MYRIRSLLNIHCMLLGYSFKPSPNSLAFGTSDSVMTIGLSISNARTRKTSSTRENMADWSRSMSCADLKGLAPNMADWSRSMSCADLKGLAPFRQGLLFSSSMKKKTKESSARTVSYRLYFKVADPGEWPGGGGGQVPPYFWKIFLGRPPPPTYLRVWITGPSLSQGVDPALL